MFKWFTIEKFNSTVRAIVTLLFAGSFCYGFIVEQTIKADMFATVALAVILWWFKARDEEHKDETVTKAVLAVKKEGG